MVIKNVMEVTKRGPRPLPSPCKINDVTTDEQLYDLIMDNFDPFGDQELLHFGLTPIYKIPLG